MKLILRRIIVHYYRCFHFVTIRKFLSHFKLNSILVTVIVPSRERNSHVFLVSMSIMVMVQHTNLNYVIRVTQFAYAHASMSQCHIGTTMVHNVCHPVPSMHHFSAHKSMMKVFKSSEHKYKLIDTKRQ
jgi:hypothetical protein